jgi:zinc transport system substrate-binding protein
MGNYVAKLEALDAAYQQVVDQAACPVLLFGDRFPFRYLAEDYGLSYYAAFSGCSAETEASFGTITFLAGKVDELGLPVVFSIDGSDQKIARVIAENTIAKSAKVQVLDSMQSVSAADIEAGENYLSIMERNLEALKEALPGTWR